VRADTEVPVQARHLWPLVLGLGIAVAAPPATAQTIVGPQVAAKAEGGKAQPLIDRLRDGWGSALVLAGEGAEHETVADTLSAMIAESLKVVGLERLDADGRLTVKAAMVRAERRVREATRTIPRSGSSRLDARTETQRALDEYLWVLETYLPVDATARQGAHER
jgi:hypothetical protein